MKKISYIALLAVIVSVFSSCNDFLTEEPKSKTTSDVIYASESGCIAGTRSIYLILTKKNYGADGATEAHGITPAAQRFFYFLAEYPGDDVRVRNMSTLDRVAMDTYEFDADNENVSAIYFSHFLGIKECNVAIRGLRTSPVENKALLAALEGEARAMRAYLYFNYVRFFGEGPVITEDTNLATDVLTRRPIKEIYKLIVSDLVYAASVLPNRQEEGAGRMSAAAAKTLLGEVYLTMAGRVYDDVKDAFDHMSRKEMFRLSAQYAHDVMEMPEYELFDDYRNLFTVLGNNSRESILEAVTNANNYPVEAYPDTNNSQDYEDAATTKVFKGMQVGTNNKGKPVYITKSYGRITVSDPMVALLKEEPDDARLKALERVYNLWKNEVREVYSVTKYADSTLYARGEKNAAQSRAQYKVIRLANAYLIFAEAMNEYNEGPDGEAQQALEDIRKRSNVSTPAPSSYLEFQKAVRDERRKEFLVEGYRWFDLVRTNQLIEKVSAVPCAPENNVYPKVLEKHYLFPIPNIAFELNPHLGDNNPGWN